MHRKMIPWISSASCWGLFVLIPLHRILAGHHHDCNGWCAPHCHCISVPVLWRHRVEHRHHAGQRACVLLNSLAWAGGACTKWSHMYPVWPGNEGAQLYITIFCYKWALLFSLWFSLFLLLPGSSCASIIVVGIIVISYNYSSYDYYYCNHKSLLLLLFLLLLLIWRLLFCISLVCHYDFLLYQY